METLPLVSVLTFAPLVGALFLLIIPEENRSAPRVLALGFSLIPLLLVALISARFDPSSAQLQFVENLTWIPTLGVQYYVAVDGLSLLMLWLTALVTPMTILASWNVSNRAALYFSLLLMVETGLFGTFTAFNFFHWFLFWELSLVPAFFLVKLWGGRDRSMAATQFFVYTMVGSVAMLLGFLALVLVTGTFDFVRLAEMAQTGQLQSALTLNLSGHGWSVDAISFAIFLGIFLGFAVKVPLIPFHTWLPLTYAEAPTAVTMVLTGLMSKMGVYGFLRVLMPIFPDRMQMILPVLLFLAVATIVFSAFAAFAQNDLKRILAYSSINHLGYCLLGVFAASRLTDNTPLLASEKAAALSGVVLQMFNHGLTAAALFCFVGFLEQRSGGLRTLNDFQGLRKVAPVFCGLMGIAMFASLGLPGLNGFVGEFLIFKGAFTLASWAAVCAALGLLITAVFLLNVMQRVFHGPVDARCAGFKDLSPFERAIVGPAVALMFVVGVYPSLLLDLINTTVLRLVYQIQ